MRRLNWYIVLVGSLVTVSLILYFIQISVFHRTADTFFYMLQDLAFVPIQVLLVSLIITGLLNMREKRLRLEKMNMVIGTFFSEVGTRLIAHFSDFDPKLENIRTNLIVRKEWSDQEFAAVIKKLKDYNYEVTIHAMNLEDLRIFLMAKRDFWCVSWRTLSCLNTNPSQNFFVQFFILQRNWRREKICGHCQLLIISTLQVMSRGLTIYWFTNG